ncbi:MAG: IS256 family transposase, partial [Bdellovibrionales bacterium]|nr:IS256 family transposase [Bdellovibrionales bacterium]
MVEDKINILRTLRKQVLEGNEDTLRSLVKSAAELLMSSEADALCGAGYGERTDSRENQRNGYRYREWDTRAGTIELAVPKLRQGSYYPSWLLSPRRRAEEALIQVVVECYLRGVSTRRVDGLVETMGLKGMSKSQVSDLAKRLDQVVEDFRARPLDGSPYRYLWLDALTQRCRDGGRVVNVWLLVATGVTADGRREILGFEVITQEDGPSWTAFLRTLVARGLSGVELVISDAHA